MGVVTSLHLQAGDIDQQQQALASQYGAAVRCSAGNVGSALLTRLDADWLKSEKLCISLPHTVVLSNCLVTLWYRCMWSCHQFFVLTWTERWGAGVVICLERGADLLMAQPMPLPLTVSRFSKIQIGFAFLVPAHPGSPRQRAVKRVCVGLVVILIFAHRSCSCNFYPATSRGAEYCDKHVCLSVCEHISWNPHPAFISYMYLCMLLIAMSWLSSGCIAIPYVLPVLQMALYLYIMAKNRWHDTNAYTEIGSTGLTAQSWRHGIYSRLTHQGAAVDRERSVISTIALFLLLRPGSGGKVLW